MLRRAVSKTLSVAIMALVLLMQPVISKATLIEADLFTAGDSLLTRDTDTGVDWLDVTETQGKSVNDILGGAGGWIGLGFIHATTAEVNTFFLNSGPGVIVDVGFTTQNRQPGIDLLGLVGITDVSPQENAFAQAWAGIGEPGVGRVYAPFLRWTIPTSTSPPPQRADSASYS
jgi:hypothetical protein